MEDNGVIIVVKMFVLQLVMVVHLHCVLTIILSIGVEEIANLKI